MSVRTIVETGLLPDAARLKACIQGWDDDAAIVVHDGATRLAELDLGEGPVLVRGDLEVTGDIIGMDDGAGFLVVFGSCRVRHLLIGGPEVWIERDLEATGSVLADYNHGVLTVGGDLRAREVFAEHLVEVGGHVDAVTVDFGGLSVRSPGFVPTITREQATRECARYFVPEVLNDQGYVTGHSIFERLRAGQPVLRATR